MDEQALSELLECSVCLERLDHTSKVLPCQHTFCRRCLEEIVSTQQELRCPECRTLVRIRVEDLPPNILLVRLLEGLKSHGHVLSSKPASYQRKRDQSADGRQPTQRTAWDGPQPCARALYSYDASEKDDLAFKKGDIVTLRRQIDDNWYQGELSGQIGVFPASYVQVLVPLPQIPQCRALYDFQLDDENEKDCLTFKKNEVITVIRRVDTNWIEGRKCDKIGILPLAFVELNHAAKTLVSSKITSASQSQSGQSSGSNRSSSSTSAPTSTPTTTTTATTSSSQPSISPISAALLASKSSPQKRHSFSPKSESPSPPPQVQRRSLELGGKSGDGQGETSSESTPNTSTPVTSLTETVGSEEKSTTASRSISVPDSPLPPEPVPSKEGGSSSNNNGGNTSGVSVSSLSFPIYVAMYNYRPQKDDEVELCKGDYYTVTEKCQDGWFKGQCLRTGMSGVFPGNYVQFVKQPSAFKPVNSDLLNLRAKVNSSHLSHHSQSHHHHHNNSTTPQFSDSNSSSNASPPIPPHIRTSSAAPPLLPRVARMSSLSSSSAVIERHSPDFSAHSSRSPHSSRSISNTHVPVTVSGGKSLSGVSGVLRSVSAPTGSCQDASHHHGSSSSVTSGNSKSASSSSSRLSASTCVQEMHHHRSSSPHRKQWWVHHHMSASTNITPPNVVVGASESSGSPLALLTKDKDKREKREKEKKGLGKLWQKASGRKSKSPAADRLCADAVAHTRSGSYPSESTSPCSSRDSSQHRKTASLDSSTSPSIKMRSRPQIRERYRCIVPYPPQTEHELELELGDIVHVHKRREDGWYKGTQERTSKTGLFPGSFVEKCD